MGKNNSRRNVLKCTGTAIAASSALAVPAAAQGEAPTVDEEMETLAETKSHAISKTQINGSEYVVYVGKTDGSVSVRELDEDEFGILSNEDLGIVDDGDRIEPQGHDEVIERARGFYKNRSDCGGYVYSEESFVGVSIETGETLDELTSEILAAAICGLAAHFLAGPVAAIVAGVGCAIFATLVLDHADLSGITASFASRDYHGGWGNTSRHALEISSEYTNVKSEFEKVDTIKGLHNQYYLTQ